MQVPFVPLFFCEKKNICLHRAEKDGIISAERGGLTLKVVAKPVNMIAVFNVNDRPCPFRFRFLDEHHRTVEVTVEHVFSVEERKTAGTDAFRYECQSRIRGQERR